jgi:hypothetical protein
MKTIEECQTDLPSWLREKYASLIEAARAEIVRQAKRGMRGNGENDAGLIADQKIKTILANAGTANPSEASAKAYRTDHTIMLASAQTPADKANTFQHFNRLRTGWKFGEIEAIKRLRRAAEAARKAKDYERMRLLTVDAFERAILLDAMFLSSLSAPSRQTWGKKAAALRAAGIEKIAGKSKRGAGRSAPTPDQLLVLLSRQRLRCVRVEVAASIFACFGIRPAELQNGARLFLEGDSVGLEVRGAKVDSTRGQALRRLLVNAAPLGRSAMAVAVLREEVEASRTFVQLSKADIVAVRRAMRGAQPGLSPYAYRHARASDAKASHGAQGAAAWLGHRTDRAQSGYGHARSSQGAVSVRATHTSRPICARKRLPGSRTSAPQPTNHQRRLSRPCPPGRSFRPRGC